VLGGEGHLKIVEVFGGDAGLDVSEQLLEALAGEATGAAHAFELSGGLDVDGGLSSVK
jgi:hypothetical protein